MRGYSWSKFPRAAILGASVLYGGASFADAARFYEDALRRFNAGDTDGALIQLRNSLQRDPAQLAARVLMGKIHLDLGNLQQAEEELAMAEKLGADPALIAVPLARARNQLGKYKLVSEQLVPTRYPVAQQADLWAELGVARLGNDDRTGAEIAFAKALELVPHHQQVLIAQAQDLMHRGEYATGAPLVEDIVNRYPDNADGWFLMGTVYQARREFDAAVAHYRRALALEPRHQRAAMGEALALLDGGKPEQAVALLEGIRKKHPSSLDAQYFYVQALKRLGRIGEAEKILDNASDLVSAVNPAELGENAGQLLLAATVTFENREYEASYRFLSRYLELRPGDLRASKRLARLLLRMNQAAEASRLLTRLKINNPDDIELLVMLGDVQNNLHDYLAAEQYYQQALQRIEDSPALIGRLGLSQLQQGRLDAAIQTFQQLLGRDPTSGASASVFLGILYLADERFVEAQEVAERIIAEQPDNVVALNLQAAALISQGQTKRGRAILQMVLDKDAGFRPARFNLVRLDILEGRLAQARETVGPLLAEQPDDQLALREAARLAVAEGDRRTAVQLLERIRQLNPLAVRPISELVELYLATDQQGEALRVARSLDQQLPDNLLAKKMLAKVQLARGELAGAEGTLVDAAQLAGANPKELVQIAGLQSKAGMLEQAEWNLRKAIGLRPELVGSRLALAELLARQRRYQDAVAETTEALRLEPDNLAAITLMADIKLAQNATDEAIMLYQRARSLSDRPELAVSLHAALVRGGQAAEALEMLRSWHRARPDSPPVMRALADHLHQTGDQATARDLYRRLTELEPGNAEVHNNLANLLQPVDSELALRTALRAYELAPKDAAVLDTLGWMLVQLGELERGLAHLREALARNSRAPTIRYHLAVALEEFGNVDEARRELRTALQAEIPFPERSEAEQRLMRLNARL